MQIYLARHWNHLATLVLDRYSDTQISLDIDATLLYFPLGLLSEMHFDCKDIWDTWPAYLRVCLKHGLTTLKNLRVKTRDIFSQRTNPMALEETVLKLIIRSLLPLNTDLPEELVDWLAAWSRSLTRQCGFTWVSFIMPHNISLIN